jgi:FG-GAP-like repeat
MRMQHKAVAGVILSLALAQHLPAQCSFDAPRLRSMPAATPVGVADFDLDGQPDLVTPTAVYYGLTEAAALPFSEGELAVRVADVDRDGLTDIVGVSPTALTTLHSLGRQGWRRQSTPFASTGGALVWGNFNGDPYDDVYVSGGLVYLGGANGFTTQNGPAHFGLQPLIAADVDGDGRDDLVGASAAGSTQAIYYLRQGNGFAEEKNGPLVPGPPRAAADFDNDGRDDVVFGASNPNNGGAVVVFNFSHTSANQVGGILFNGTFLTIDLTGDGAPELVRLTVLGPSIYLNDGRGELRWGPSLPGGPMPLFFDVDRDGILDYLMIRNGEGTTLHGNGDGTFRLPFVAVGPSGTAAAGDFDGDGDDDIVTQRDVSWNRGNNTFDLRALAGLTGLVRTAADVDGDGTAEIVTFDSNSLFIFAARSLTAAEKIAEIRYAPGLGALNAIPIMVPEVAPGDFSGSGKQELAVLAYGKLQVFEGRNGAAPRFVIPAADARDVEAADMNGDGIDDLVVAGGPQSGGGYIDVFLSTRTSFTPGGRFAHPNALDEIAAGDFNGDGRMDVAAGESFRYRLNIFTGDGTGLLAPAQSLALPGIAAPMLLRAADFDGDGADDLSVNGGQRFFFGSAADVAERARYLSYVPEWNLLSDVPPFSPLVVRPGRRALPSMVAVTAGWSFIYRPVCPRGRAIRK